MAGSNIIRMVLYKSLKVDDNVLQDISPIVYAYLLLLYCVISIVCQTIISVCMLSSFFFFCIVSADYLCSLNWSDPIANSHNPLPKD